jgi:hypothetical protein
MIAIAAHLGERLEIVGARLTMRSVATGRRSVSPAGDEGAAGARRCRAGAIVRAGRLRRDPELDPGAELRAVFWGFFLLVGVGLFVLRAKSLMRRPFRVPGYPVVPALFVAMCAYLLYASLAYHREHALVGLGVLAAGAVIMVLNRLRSRR